MFPGGFSYGDHTGSGNAYAHKVRNNLWEHLHEFIQRDTLLLGICNGFQIMVRLGLLPALQGAYGTQQVSLMTNKTAQHIDRWVDLTIENKTPWLNGMKTISLPIAHGEGNLYAPKDTLTKLKENNQIAVRYTKGEICKLQTLEPNPNGSVDDIAGITDESGRILGMMPHPERSLFFTHLPHWQLLKEQYKREGKKLPNYADGVTVFKNGVQYFS